jgi:hypothetical protein
VVKLYNRCSIYSSVHTNNNYNEEEIAIIAFINKFKDFIRSFYMHKQRSSEGDMNDGIALTVIYIIKAIILFKRYQRGNKLFSNIEKNMVYKTPDEFILKNQYFGLKESFVCSGCDIFLNKAETKMLSKYENFYICETCAEIYCQ